MLARFSLYGFLKNQQYFEPFIILAFLEKGLSFFMIGLLISFREICINLFEVPSGAVADLYGRRKAMIFSFIAYIISFLIFGMTLSVFFLFVVMFFFAIGEAFRTGTHKAIIFDWLRSQGQEGKRTEIYGYTRSWSKKGSAVSVVIASLLVFYRGNYSDIFLFSTIPYFIGIFNFLGYPKNLDGIKSQTEESYNIFSHIFDNFSKITTINPLKRLFFESLGFEGGYKTTKDYIQPILKNTILSVPIFLYFDDVKRVSILIGIVYFFIYILSSSASKRSHLFVSYFKTENSCARALWELSTLLFFLMTLFFAWNNLFLIVICFILLEILQNIWRPIHISRFDNFSDASSGATILSIESQAKSLFPIAAAPVLGYAVDIYGLSAVSILGLTVGFMAIITSPKKVN